jgi:hypothetical protein
MEEFACSRRNIRASIEDLSNIGWADEPCSVASVMAVDHASILMWELLYHAPLRDAITVPEAPVPAKMQDGIAGSMHAPEMEVDSNPKPGEGAIPSLPPTPSDENTSP